MVAMRHVLPVFPNHQEEGDTLSWVARKARGVLESRIRARCIGSRCILMVVKALESEPRKSCLSGAFVFPDQPLIRIPQKTLGILHWVVTSCIRKITTLPAYMLQQAQLVWRLPELW